ncbi:Pentatricopeptide repeat-containing protein At1g62930 [Durusdinium trenchii]
MMIITVCYKIDTWAKAGALYVISPADWNAVTRDMYSNFHGVSSNIRQVHSLVAFNTILTWFKAVKYINIIPYVTTFMQTVSISQVNLGSWIVVFCCTLTGFVLAFSTAFGADVSALRTPFQAFVFIMLTILGNSDVSVIYEVAPFLGSLLIIIYVVGIFFVIMNLFYAIIVSTLSDAKMEEDAKQKKKWAVMGDRINDTWKALNRGGKLEKQFRSCFPGLYSRLMRRQKRIELKEKARDDMVLAKEMKLRREDMSLALGPGSSAWGRRPKRQLATVAMEDKESDSDASEPDLGPLRSSDQLREKEDNLFAPVMDDEPTEQDLTDEGIDLVIDATRHVAFGVVERTKGARGVLFGEMSESMDVLNNVATVLEVLGKRTRDLEAQQRQLDKRLEVNTIHYNTMLAASRRDWEVGLLLLGQMPSKKLRPTTVSFNSIMGAANWQQVLELLTTMQNIELRPSQVSYNTAMSACAGQDAWEKALMVFDQLDFRDQISYSTTITACERGNSWQGALDLLGTMSLQQLIPDVITFSAAISAAGIQWPVVIELLESSIQLRVTPNQISYSASISACEKGHQWITALDLLSCMFREDVTPNEISFSAAISSCEKASRWPIACSLLASMSTLRLQVDAISYNPVIVASANGCEWELALSLFSEMPAKLLAPDAFSYTAVTTACARTSQWQIALALWRSGKVKASEITWNSVISACEKGGQWELALFLFGQTDLHAQESTFGTAISACSRAALWQEALTLLSQCQRQHLLPSVVSFCTAMSACEGVAPWQQSLQLFCWMWRDRVSPNLLTYTSLISAFGKAWQWEFALSIFHQMQRGSQVAAPDAVTCCAVIAACERDGRRHLAIRAISLLADLAESQIQPYRFWRGRTYKDIGITL